MMMMMMVMVMVMVMVMMMMMMVMVMVMMMMTMMMFEQLMTMNSKLYHRAPAGALYEKRTRGGSVIKFVVVSGRICEFIQ